MNMEAILLILELVTGLARTAATGTGAEKDVAMIQGLEAIARAVAEGYQSQTGQPMDLAKLLPEEPIS
jgi:hypothetical protein